MICFIYLPYHISLINCFDSLIYFRQKNIKEKKNAFKILKMYTKNKITKYITHFKLLFIILFINIISGKINLTFLNTHYMCEKIIFLYATFILCHVGQS